MTVIVFCINIAVLWSFLFPVSLVSCPTLCGDDDYCIRAVDLRTALASVVMQYAVSTIYECRALPSATAAAFEYKTVKCAAVLRVHRMIWNKIMDLVYTRINSGHHRSEERRGLVAEEHQTGY